MIRNLGNQGAICRLQDHITPGSDPHDSHQQKGCHMFAPWHTKLEPGPGISATATPGEPNVFVSPLVRRNCSSAKAHGWPRTAFSVSGQSICLAEGGSCVRLELLRPAAQRMELLEPVCSSVAQLPHFTQVWNPKFPVGTGWGWDQCSRASPSRTEIKLLRYVPNI